MLRSLPTDFNQIHYIMRENGILSKKGFIGRTIPVVYRYSLPGGCVTGEVIATFQHSNTVLVKLDNGKRLVRSPKSFDMIGEVDYDL